MRKGFSILELMVVLSIVGVLVSLTLIAVNSARESGRKLTCQNNLRQIGIALANFESSTRRFPSLIRNRTIAGERYFECNPFVTILPELEVKIRLNDAGKVEFSDSDEFLVPSVLRCPTGDEYLAYRYSMGAEMQVRHNESGMLRYEEGIRSSEITDGLSNTVHMAERMMGKPQVKPSGVVLLEAPEFGVFSSRCQSSSRHSSFAVDNGLRWLGYQAFDLAYNHVRHQILWDGTAWGWLPPLMKESPSCS